ncbi:MAG: hypothetical protein KDC80_27480, partial [Saprospiraceae bacterium]|nr:hypothetical protein [Saprospiraceae bacterium]
MKFILYTLAIFTAIILSTPRLWGQIVENGDTRYGNEWINYDQSYLKIKVGEDGIYRISQEQLIEAGVPVSDIDVAEYRLYWIGKEQRLLTSRESGPLQGGDDLLFYGRKNRSEVDRFLFSDPDRQMLNPEYGLTTDTSAYFLTWTPGVPSNVRFHRVENDLSNPGSPLPWYIHHEKLVFSEAAFKGAINSEGVRYSTYGEGEGFGSSLHSEHSFVFNAKDYNLAGSAAKLHLRVTGSIRPHEVTIDWNGNDLGTLEFAGANQSGGSVLVDTFFSLDLSKLKPENIFKSTTSGSTDEVIYGLLELTYPRNFAFSQERSVHINLNNIADGAYFEFLGFDNQGQSPFVFDLTDGKVIIGEVEGDETRVKIPPGSESRSFVIISVQSISNANLFGITFENLSNSSAEFILISHKKLMLGENVVEQYADYRSSKDGGNYKTQIIEINQLVNQFAYGVYKHPLSTKNFSNYIRKNWQNPKFIFL